MTVHPLDGARAKLERAKSHVGALRDAISAAEPDPAAIPLRREYDVNQGAIVWRIERVPEIPDSWGLLVGDALHNFRCALDHLWWQLALKHLHPNQPTEEQAKEIQFPIFSRPTQWSPTHPYLRHVDPTDAVKVEARQPFNPGQAGQINVLGALADLSNADKHRIVHPVLMAARGILLPTPSDQAFKDCEPVRQLIKGQWVRAAHFSVGLRPDVDDEILKVEVTPTGPNPDLDFNTTLACEIVLGEVVRKFVEV